MRPSRAPRPIMELHMAPRIDLPLLADAITIAITRCKEPYWHKRDQILARLKEPKSQYLRNARRCTIICEVYHELKRLNP